MSPIVQGVILCMMICEVGFLILEATGDQFVVDAWVMLVIAAIFFLETLGRLLSQGVEHFFSSPWNTMDFIIVILSSIEACVVVVRYVSDVVDDDSGQGLPIPRIFRPLMRMQKFIRFIRVLRVFRVWVGCNKARVVDKSLGINIDLTLITEDVIAMSVPACGATALYRNPIGEVVRFFDTKYPDNYRIYNACPELPYPLSKFKNQVRCFDIQDHSPPSMDNIFDFLSDATEWMSEKGSEERVIAIHCKGGKGRTGTLICAWFLYNRTCETLDTAMELFATRRTDQTRKGKLQGVETKGQIRYLRYVDQWLRQEQMYSPAPAVSPPAKVATISKVRLCRLLAKEASKFGSGLIVELRNPSWWAGLGPLVAQVEVPLDEVHAQLTAPDGEQVVTIDLGQEVWVEGDFRIDVLATRWMVQKKTNCLRRGPGTDQKEEPVPRPPRSSRSSTMLAAEGDDSFATALSSMPSESMIIESNTEKLKKRVEAGKVSGLWIYAHIHSAFMGDGPVYELDATDLDMTKLQKKQPATRLNDSGKLELEFSVVP